MGGEGRLVPSPPFVIKGTMKNYIERLPLGDMLPDAAALLLVFSKQQRPLRLDALLRCLDLPRRCKKDLEKKLENLAAQGQLMRMHGGAWVATAHCSQIKGVYSRTRSGAGFVTPLEKNEHGRKKLTQDIFIPAQHSGGAWHGDTVLVVLSPTRTGKSPEGRIVAVLERGQKEIAVRVLRLRGGLAECRPADPRLDLFFDTDLSALEQPVAENDLLLISPVAEASQGRWRARALATFGREDDIAVQERLVKLNHQAPAEFSPRALIEAAALPAQPQPAEYAHRQDLRGLPFVTIDGRTARDFDDAIHVSKTAQGWLLRVAIADVSHYVRPKTALDKEAFERGNSWYFPTSVEPMLPKVLSHGLCSLNPHEDRLVMLAEIAFNEQGYAGAASFAPAVICSVARLTYWQVKAVLEEEGEARQNLLAQEQGASIVEMLGQAQGLAALLAAVRTARGALDFDLPEPEYHFDAQGRLTAITRKERHFAHKMIEECMIAANEAVARFLEEHEKDFLYRVHPEPEQDKLLSLYRTLHSTALAASVPDKPDAQALQGILRAAHGTEQEYLVGRLTLRTMPQARYQPANEGHFGLASTCYCHFTSPIRRYADVIVHRALKAALGIEGGGTVAAHALLRVADQLNRRERAAMEAEREIGRRLACLALQQSVGKDFSGIICSVNDFGVFVELDALPVEGMVRVEDLGDDYYEYDMERQELIGVLTGRRFRLGQRVQTRLAEVNTGRLEIRLTLQGVTKSARKAQRPPARKAKQGGYGRPVKRGAQAKESTQGKGRSKAGRKGPASQRYDESPIEKQQSVKQGKNGRGGKRTRPR